MPLKVLIVCLSISYLTVSNAFSQKAESAVNTLHENELHRHQIGVIIGYDFGLTGRYWPLLELPKHTSIGACYDYTLNRRQRFLTTQIFGDVEYVEGAQEYEPLNRDMSADVGFRLLAGKSWFRPLIELSSNVHINVSKERSELFRSDERYNNLGFGYGYSAGFGAVFKLRSNLGVSLKSSYSALSPSILTNAARSATYAEAKVFYAF